MAWQTHHRKKLVTMLEDMRLMLQAVVPHYWQRFDEIVAEEELDTAVLPKQDSPGYWCKLLEYLLGAGESMTGRPMDEETQMKLCAHEAAASGEVASVMPDVDNMAWHLALKRSIQRLWEDSWYSPQSKVLYGLWDHMVPCISKHKKQ